MKCLCFLMRSGWLNFFLIKPSITDSLPSSSHSVLTAVTLCVFVFSYLSLKLMCSNKVILNVSLKHKVQTDLYTVKPTYTSQAFWHQIHNAIWHQIHKGLGSDCSKLASWCFPPTCMHILGENDFFSSWHRFPPERLSCSIKHCVKSPGSSQKRVLVEETWG